MIFHFIIIIIIIVVVVVIIIIIIELQLVTSMEIYFNYIYIRENKKMYLPISAYVNVLHMIAYAMIFFLIFFLINKMLNTRVTEIEVKFIIY